MGYRKHNNINNDREKVIGTLLWLAGELQKGKDFEWNASFFEENEDFFDHKTQGRMSFEFEVTIKDPDTDIYEESVNVSKNQIHEPIKIISK
jgi:hypothetical protein